jgi:cytochrome c oxidase subunit 4
MRHSALRIVRRGLATAAAHPPHAGSSTSHVTAATSAIPLSNVEAQWATLSPSEQTAVHQQLEELQRKDWKTLSLAEKKAGTSYSLFSLEAGVDGLMCFVLAYYVAFGPHGPRAPVNPPGTTVKIITGVSALIGAAGLLYTGFRAIGTLLFLPVCNNLKFFLFSKKKKTVTAPPPPRTITKEWEEASNERAKELKINPISGP